MNLFSFIFLYVCVVVFVVMSVLPLPSVTANIYCCLSGGNNNTALHFESPTTAREDYDFPN